MHCTSNAHTLGMRMYIVRTQRNILVFSVKFDAATPLDLFIIGLKNLHNSFDATAKH